MNYKEFEKFYEKTIQAVTDKRDKKIQMGKIDKLRPIFVDLIYEIFKSFFKFLKRVFRRTFK